MSSKFMPETEISADNFFRDASSTVRLTNTWQMVDHKYLCWEHFLFRTLVRMLLYMHYTVKAFVKHSVKLANTWQALSEHFEAYCLSSVPNWD